MILPRTAFSSRVWHSIPKEKPACRAEARYLSNKTTTHSRIQTSSPRASLKSDLDRIAPRIDIDASQIQVLQSPEEFYLKLKTQIKNARRRIYLSTLYIGKSEHELIATIREALTSNPVLRVSILTDALRGNRESPQVSCASLLAPLARDFPGRVEIRMYHTPNLTGFRKVFIPKRINEGWGLQHMKLYGVDDEITLSGANLSNDYFTNRQDRYHVFKSKHLTDYFARIHHTVCSISGVVEFSTNPAGHTLSWPESNKAPNPLFAPAHHKASAASLLKPLVSPPSNPAKPSDTGTSVYPLLCLPPSINTELPAITLALAKQRQIEQYTFTAGYFNPHPSVTSALLALSSAPQSVPGTVLTASPYANGFFGSKGISGMLPAAYSRLSLLFLRAARGNNVQLREWRNGSVGRPGGWTYHAKGLWVTLPQSPVQEAPQGEAGGQVSAPSVMVVGSSNYTTRSYGLDLEIGAMVVTSDERLQMKWKREVAMLEQHTAPVTEQELEAPDRKASWRVRLAMWTVKMVGGAL